jgi:DHA2 family multidrug resistance protein
VGVLALSLISQLVEDPPFLRRVKAGEMRLDTIGLSMLVLGVGALQIMLDRGQEADWFSSHFITVLAVIGVVCLAFLVLWEWDDKGPIVDVRLFRYINFSGSCVIIFFAGIVSFSVSVLMPQFLQVFMGYTSQKAGLVVSAGAGIMLITIPLVGVLTSFVPAKYLIAVGWLGSAIAMFWSAHVMSMQIDIGTASMMMVIQFVPIGFIFVPAITASYFGVPKDRSDSVSGLTNFMRNIGSSIGTSVVLAGVARRSQFHLSRMTDHTALGNADFTNQIQGLVFANHMQSAGVGMADAQPGALTQIYQFVFAQASTLSYIDVYYLMGAASVVMLFLSLFLKTNDPRNTEQHAAH